MSESYEVVEERADYRVILVVDQSPEEPDASQSPLIRFDRGTARHLHLSAHFGLEDRIEEAADRWGPPNRDTWHLFETYMRAFHGTTAIETYYSGTYWYVTYDTAEWRKVTGASGPDMSEWESWCKGEVYGYVVQKRVKLYVKSEEFSDFSEYGDSWEDVDSLWGLYGYNYAIKAAREALDDTVGSESK